MFCTRVAWVCLLLCKEEGSSPVSEITERMDMGLYEVPLCMSLWGFGMVRNASPRGPMCFRCLIFSLSGPCDFVLLPLEHETW